jgi:F-type H+-transporting ATPase subunit epsilon
MPIAVEVVSRTRALYSTDRADMVIIPGSEGVLGVLPNHTPLLTTLAVGELRILEGKNVISFVVYGGVVDIRPDRVIVLADDAESAVEIDLEKAEAARQRAHLLMTEGPSDTERAQIAQELRRAEIAVQVYHRSVHHGPQIRTLKDENETR